MDQLIKKNLFMSIVWTAIFAVPSTFAGNLCSNFFFSASLENLNEPTHQLLQQLISLRLGTRLAKSIEFRDVQSLETLEPFFRRFEKHWNTLSENEKSKLAVRLKIIFSSSPELRQMRDILEGRQSYADPNGPMQRALRKKFLLKSIEFLRRLPPELRWRSARPPIDKTDPQEIALAQRTVSDAIPSFNELFQTYEGFPISKYLERIKKSSHTEVQQALSMIDKNLKVIMRRHERTRSAIEMVGFENQFVTKTSSGALSPEMRNKTESEMINANPDEYMALTAEVKPKYGTLMIDPYTGVDSNLMASEQYGTDIYVFKTEDIKNRLTLYPGDSLGREIDTSFDLGALGAPQKINPHWLNRMIPWSYRQLFTAYLLEALQKKQFSLPTVDKAVPPELKLKIVEKTFKIDLSALPPTPPPAPEPSSKETSTAPEPPFPFGDSVFPTMGSFTSWGYWETQIWGPITLENVESFTFKAHPPSGAFLQKLLNLKIPIYDWRGEAPQIWNPLDEPYLNQKGKESSNVAWPHFPALEKEKFDE